MAHSSPNNTGQRPERIQSGQEHPILAAFAPHALVEKFKAMAEGVMQPVNRWVDAVEAKLLSPTKHTPSETRI